MPFVAAVPPDGPAHLFFVRSRAVTAVGTVE
jgi:hypothetical protein